MAYNILIDTSIFVNQCFCFDNKSFIGLSKLSNAGLINLFITDVVKAEVEKRITVSIKNGEKIIRKEAHILGAYLNIKPKDIIQNIITSFHNYITLYVTVLKVPEYFIGKRIITNYLNNKPPFDNAKENKKQEFPDAFIIETFDSYLEEINQKGVFLSADKDCKTFIDNCERLEYVNDIGALLDKLNRENEKYVGLISQAINNPNSNLGNIINQFITSLDIDNYEYTTHELSHNSFLDYDLSSVEYIQNSFDINKNEYEIYDIDSEEQYVQMSIPVSYQVAASWEAEDYDNAIYDKEDDRYYFLESIVLKNNFRIEDIEISIGLDLNTGNFEILSESNEIDAEFDIDEPLE